MTYSSKNRKKTPEPSFIISEASTMSRTYVKGRKGYKRIDHKHGHCFICGWNPKFSMRRKTEKKKVIVLDILPFLDSFFEAYH